MFASPFTRLLNDLRRRLGPAVASDGLLLRQYVEHRDQQAFATLVHRHGPIVWGVCLRKLPQEADAEDAFQATFLVLARKASTLVGHNSVAAWLYGVALRVASQLRRSRARRQHHEEGWQAMAQSRLSAGQTDELCAVVDEELARLPEKYRMPVLLCHMQGHSREQAAQELGMTELQIKGNLQRGRELLRRRLEQRGLALTVMALAAALETQVSASPPSRVLDLAVKVAMEDVASSKVLALTKGALSAMFWSKMRIAGVILGSIALLCGTVVFQVLRSEAVAYVPVPEKPRVAHDPLVSQPAVVNGLSITVRPTKRAFTRDEPLEFDVTFKNVSKESFLLFDNKYYWDWQHRFAIPELKKGEPFRGLDVIYLVDAKRRPEMPVLLAPNGSITTKVVFDPANQRFGFRPSHQTKPQKPLSSLPLGRHAYTIAKEYSPNRDPLIDYAAPFWTGTITSNPVVIEIVEK